MKNLITDLPHDAQVFCDANIITYAFLGTMTLSPVCEDLVKRGANRELTLFTSVMQASHVIHRIMIREAILTYDLEPRKALGYLKKHPLAVRSLTRYKEIPDEFTRSRIRILDVTYREIHASKRFRDEYGLLTDDSMILATMERHGIKNLASNDRDFKRVRDIQLWTPTV